MDKLDSWISSVGSSNAAEKTPPSAQNSQQKNEHPLQQSTSSEQSSQKKRGFRKFFGKNKKQNSQQSPTSSRSKGGNNTRLRVIPLGGLDEVGRNCMCLEYGNDMILIDVGVQFAEDDMHGIEFILPDTRYIEQKRQNFRGIVITHGHLDHIGGLKFLMNKLKNPPIYAPPLAAGLIKKQFEEAKLNEPPKLITIDPKKDTLKIGAFTIEYYHVNHSIPDSNGLYIQTPNAKIVHTGDFKFDFTPADGVPCDYVKIAEIGKRGVDAIFSDSTNAQKPGYCVSEKVVQDALEVAIKEASGRLYIASFSSLLARWQQIIRFAQKYHRKIYVTGRSLLENLRIASDLGYIKVPQGLIHKVSKRINDTPAHQQIILCTGSQGEENAALSRIARGENDLLQIQKGDTVVLSSNVIPGNERAIITTIDHLYRIGARVITRKDLDVHTSGHAHQGDLKMMYSFMKPKNVVPIHGEFHMRTDHAKMVRRDLDYSEDQTPIISNGHVLEVYRGKVFKTRERVPHDQIIVDGKVLGLSDKDIQQDRADMENAGVICFTFHIHRTQKKLISPPQVMSSGCLYPQEKRHFTSLLRKEAGYLAHQILSKHGAPKEKDQLICKDLEQKLTGAVTKIIERTPKILISLVY